MRIYCGCVSNDITPLELKEDEVGISKVILSEYPMTVEKIGVRQYIGQEGELYRHYPNVDKRSCKHCGAIIYLEG